MAHAPYDSGASAGQAAGRFRRIVPWISRLCPVLIGASLFILGAGPAFGDRPERSPGIFFGASGGFGGAWIRHPELESNLRPGAALDLMFGWALSPRLAVGGQFSAWGTSILGVPVHLHTAGLRLEWTPLPPDGLYLGIALGLALTEGDVHERAGGAAVALAGYRRALARWVTLGFEGGVHGHIYADGAAAVPYGAIQLRFYGATPRE